jgi:hypothetical protein
VLVYDFGRAHRYVCEFCLKYMKSAEARNRHRHKCELKGQPPGTEIYRSGQFQIWEIDGAASKVRALPFPHLERSPIFSLELSPVCSLGLDRVPLDILPELVPIIQALSRPQNAVLRCGNVPLLRHDDLGCLRFALCGLLLEGKGFDARV